MVTWKEPARLASGTTISLAMITISSSSAIKCLIDPSLLANREAYELQQRANKELIKMAREFNIKLVCTNDCHFEDKETAEAHDHLLCIATGKGSRRP